MSVRPFRFLHTIVSSRITVGQFEQAHLDNYVGMLRTSLTALFDNSASADKFISPLVSSSEVFSIDLVGVSTDLAGYRTLPPNETLDAVLLFRLSDGRLYARGRYSAGVTQSDTAWIQASGLFSARHVDVKVLVTARFPPEQELTMELVAYTRKNVIEDAAWDFIHTAPLSRTDIGGSDILAYTPAGIDVSQAALNYIYNTIAPEMYPFMGVPTWLHISRGGLPELPNMQFTKSCSVMPDIALRSRVLVYECTENAMGHLVAIPVSASCFSSMNDGQTPADTLGTYGSGDVLTIELSASPHPYYLGVVPDGVMNTLSYEGAGAGSHTTSTAVADAYSDIFAEVSLEAAYKAECPRWLDSDGFPMTKTVGVKTFIQENSDGTTDKSSFVSEFLGNPDYTVEYYLRRELVPTLKRPLIYYGNSLNNSAVSGADDTHHTVSRPRLAPTWVYSDFDNHHGAMGPAIRDVMYAAGCGEKFDLGLNHPNTTTAVVVISDMSNRGLVSVFEGWVSADPNNAIIPVHFVRGVADELVYVPQNRNFSLRLAASRGGVMTAAPLTKREFIPGFDLSPRDIFLGAREPDKFKVRYRIGHSMGNIQTYPFPRELVGPGFVGTHHLSQCTSAQSGFRRSTNPAVFDQIQFHTSPGSRTAYSSSQILSDSVDLGVAAVDALATFSNAGLLVEVFFLNSSGEILTGTRDAPGAQPYKSSTSATDSERVYDLIIRLRADAVAEAGAMLALFSDVPFGMYMQMIDAQCASASNAILHVHKLGASWSLTSGLTGHGIGLYRDNRYVLSAEDSTFFTVGALNYTGGTDVTHQLPTFTQHFIDLFYDVVKTSDGYAPRIITTKNAAGFWSVRFYGGTSNATISFYGS